MSANYSRTFARSLADRFADCSAGSHWSCSSSSAASTLRAATRFFGVWNWSQSRSEANKRSASRRHPISSDVV